MPSSRVSGNMAARTRWERVWFNCWLMSERMNVECEIKNEITMTKCKTTVFSPAELMIVDYHC